MFLAPGFLLNMKTGIFGSPAENPSGVPQRHQNMIQTPNYRVLPDLVTAQVFTSSLPSLPCFLCSLREPCSLMFKMLLCLPTVPFFTITPHLWSGWVPLILYDLAQSLLLAKNKKQKTLPGHTHMHAIPHLFTFYQSTHYTTLSFTGVFTSGWTESYRSWYMIFFW